MYKKCPVGLLVPYAAVARPRDNAAPAHKENPVFYLSLKISRNIVANLLDCKPWNGIKSLFLCKILCGTLTVICLLSKILLRELLDIYFLSKIGFKILTLML